MSDDLVDRVSGAVARGLLAGAVGTAAMTLSSTVEARLRGRGDSSAPADAAGAVLGVEPSDSAEGRFNQLAHWGYGTALGAQRGLVALAGVRGARAAVAHLGLVLATEQIVLPATGVAPPATKWALADIGIDWWHHAVYAAVTGAAFEAMER